jgi:phospholipid/cholesterol/gamma-HCH transport system substrate-binding protein
MNTKQSSTQMTRLKVGIFSVMGLIMVGAISVIINHRPFWWRACQLVQINIEDATGLKTKSPIRSLGIEIGYLKTVALSETHVSLGICITAPVEVLPSTRAYIRGEGFLGDKFVELKPVKYLGSAGSSSESLGNGGRGQEGTQNENLRKIETDLSFNNSKISAPHQSPEGFEKLANWIFPQAYAADVPTDREATRVSPEPTTPASLASEPRSPLSDKRASRKTSGKQTREIPVGSEGQDVQHLVGRMDELAVQMGDLTENLNEAVNPEDFKKAVRQLNITLENISKTVAPDSGLNKTAQRTLAKLEDSIEQLRDSLTRINKGEGSIGMLVNDPTYAEEIKLAIKNVNHLLNKVGDFRFVVDFGASQIKAYNGSRGWFQLGIWPKKDRYYLLGLATDPRGRISNTSITTTVGGLTQQSSTQVLEQNSILYTFMLGKVYEKRLDLSAGVLFNDGTASVALHLGPNEMEERVQLRSDIYARSATGLIDSRITLMVQPWSGLYFKASLESLRAHPTNGQTVYSYGAGLRFDDDDIKLLFALL